MSANIEETVKKIVAEQLGVTSRRSAEASFIEDLGPTASTRSNSSWPWRRSSTRDPGRGRGEDPHGRDAVDYIQSRLAA